jgi:hypothetical protein
MTQDQRALFETAVVDRLKESGFLEIEIRTECLVRSGDGYQDEVTNAGWHYWNTARATSHASETARLAAQNPAHFDNKSVYAFAYAMRVKLAAKRLEGRGGWQDTDTCSNDHLSRLLREHVEKGDPVDVGNFCMMIHQRGESIAPASLRHLDVTVRDGISAALVAMKLAAALPGVSKEYDFAEAIAAAEAAWLAVKTPPQEHMREDVEAEIASVVQSVNEWDDRTSPDDYPDHLLITSEELTKILRNFANTLEGRDNG